MKTYLDDADLEALKRLREQLNSDAQWKKLRRYEAFSRGIMIAGMSAGAAFLSGYLWLGAVMLVVAIGLTIWQEDDL